MDCAEHWDEVIRDIADIAAVQDPEERNRKISAAYADLYLKNPELKWAGAAAFASKQVGCGMRQGGTRLLHGLAELDRFFGLPADWYDIRKILGDGNLAVFNDIYPALLFYANNKGCATSDQIQECLEDAPSNLDISEDLIMAFEDIESGKYDQAALKMLREEQEGPVQSVVFDRTWMRLMNKLNRGSGGRLANTDLALAADCETDEAHMVFYQDDFGPIEDFDNRWKFATSVFDAFGNAEKTEGNYLQTELRKIISADN